MRVFLSHSSANKNIVENVFDLLGHANAHYDESTFGRGSFNTEVIIEALAQCQIFSLFATKEALASGFVEFEARLAVEFFASKKIKKIITFCMDGISPRDLPASLATFAAVRSAGSPGVCARILKGELIRLGLDGRSSNRQFIGRDTQLAQVKAHLSDPEEITPVALAFSGIDGIGRRTFAARLIEDIYPGVGRILPTVSIDENFDLNDIFRQLLGQQSYPKSQVIQEITDYGSLDDNSKLQKIVSMIDVYYNNDEVITFIDNGGMLDDEGRLSAPMKSIIDKIKSKTSRLRPYMALIIYRSPPVRSRESKDAVLYFRIDALEISHVAQLLSFHVKKKGEYSKKEDVMNLADLTDGHPYNIEYVLGLLNTATVGELVSNANDLVAFKKRQGDDFLGKLNLNNNHKSVIACIRSLGQIPIEVLAESVSLSSDVLSVSLRELEEYHCIERFGDLVWLNRPLRAAIERSSVFRMTPEAVDKFQRRMLEIYGDYQDIDSVSVQIISTAAKAALFLNEDDEKLRVFLLPSNAVFVGRQLYDLRRFAECARVCKTTLAVNRFTSDGAWLEAIRLRCLSLARLGEKEAFEQTISLLEERPSRTADAQKFFLQGFQLRISGNPSVAVEKFKKSYALNENSFSTLRELFHSLMVLGESKEARKFAEAALKIAPTNPYIIDQVLALVVGEKAPRSVDILYDPEVEELLHRLERYGDEEGKSFYAIRMSDIYRRAGMLKEALDFAKRASLLTPHLFAAHMIEAEVLLRMSIFEEVRKKVDYIARMVDEGTGGEARTHLPEFIRFKIEYLSETGKYDDAIALLRANLRRLGSKADDLKRSIAFSLSAKKAQVNADNATWISG